MNVNSKSVEYLRRYTDLSALLYLLRRQKLTLLDPTSWDDRNDSHFLELYRERKDLSSVLALCFTEKGETYHHWRVFSGGSGGVCIKFEKASLIEHLSKIRGLRFGPAQYPMMNLLRQRRPNLADLPFLKRYAYKDEGEFRFIFESDTKLTTKDFHLPLSCIKKISLSPWTPKSLSTTIIETIKSIPGCEKIRIGHSSLINNKEWRNLGANAE